MRRAGILSAFAAATVLAACGPAPALVTVEVDGRGVRGVEIQLLPYDRVHLMDSLASAYGTPEPAIPQDLLDLQREISELQGRWVSLEEQWVAERERLRQFSEELETLTPGTAMYTLAFRDYRSQEAAASRIENERNEIFQTIGELQDSLTTQARSVQTVREEWERGAYADLERLIGERTRGRDIAVDTTDFRGTTELMEVDGGDWWVFARHALAYEQLVWNVPVNLVPRQLNEVLLTRENATTEPVF